MYAYSWLSKSVEIIKRSPIVKEHFVQFIFQKLSRKSLPHPNIVMQA